MMQLIGWLIDGFQAYIALFSTTLYLFGISAMSALDLLAGVLSLARCWYSNIILR
jgi:hypothetical protein